VIGVSRVRGSSEVGDARKGHSAMENAQQDRHQDKSQSVTRELWVLEGVIDAPIVLPRPESGSNQTANVRGFCIDLGPGDGDGFVELHACDVTRVNSLVWWSKDEPVLFDFRCSVVAIDQIVAWLRANDLIRQVLDRLAFSAAAPVTLVSLNAFYNELELMECEAGSRSSFRFHVGGVPTNTTGPLNPDLLRRLRPSDRTKLALRWFRKALTFKAEEDQYLAFFLALEVVSDDIKPAALVTPKCKKCGNELPKFTSHLEGIKDVISRHAELPTGTFDQLRKVRAKIAHGELSQPLTGQVRECLPLIERLAAEAIGIALAIDPTTLQARGSIRIFESLLLGEAVFNLDSNPHTRWHRSIPDAIKMIRPQSNL
jgi:hypothetical protein